MRKLLDNTAYVRVGPHERVVKNLRVRQSTLLISELMKGGASSGVTTVALGSGIGTGTLMLPQEPHAGGTSLRQEFHRQGVASVAFHDLDNDMGDTYTNGSQSNRLIVNSEIDALDSDHIITEIGLFGGTTGEYMVAWVTFPVIDNRTGGQNPDAPENISFKWVLSFPFVQPEDIS